MKAVQDEMNLKIGAVAAGVKAQGVDAKDIQTSNYSISPTYDYSSGKSRITGYQAHTDLRIKIRAIDRINGVIDTATAAGATNIGGVAFDVEDRTKYETEAKSKAVAEAKRKAAEAAGLAGFRLGRIVNYQENGPAGIMPLLPRTGSGEGVMLKSDTATRVEAGSSDITVTVTLSYELQ